MLTDMPSFATILLATLFLILAYLTYLCTTSPNPPPVNPHSDDRFTKTHFSAHTNLARIFLTCLWLYQIFLVFTLPCFPGLVCLNPENLSKKLFTWTHHTVICALFIIAGAAIRLQAYAQLGKNFTFELARPSGLVTGRLYRYMRHPSYTGLFLVEIGLMGIIFRTDAGMGCWLPGGWVESFWGNVLGWAVWMVMGSIFLTLTTLRMSDEEGMLKQAFGEEWEDWARKTQRLIPGVY